MSQMNRKHVFFVQDTVQGRTIQEFKNDKERIHFTKCSKSYIVLSHTFSLQNLNHKLHYDSCFLRWFMGENNKNIVYSKSRFP